MSEYLNIAICEDTVTDVEKLLDVLQKSSFDVKCTVFSSGEALLDEYRPNKFDLLLMDIYMGGMTGIETVTRIREFDSDIQIAFITTSTEFALESYRLSVLKYLEKPFKKNAIDDLLKLVQSLKDYSPSIIIHKNGKEEKIQISHIMYLEQQTHKVNFYLKDGTIIQIYDKLATFLPKLEEHGFFNPHKSFCVNLSYVNYINKELKCFIMTNGKNIPIRRESMSKAKKSLEDLLFNQNRGMLNEK